MPTVVSRRACVLRFLRSRIGRPFEQGSQRVVTEVGSSKRDGFHIWDHVMREIETDCYIVTTAWPTRTAEGTAGSFWCWAAVADPLGRMPPEDRGSRIVARPRHGLRARHVLPLLAMRHTKRRLGTMALGG